MRFIATFLYELELSGSNTVSIEKKREKISWIRPRAKTPTLRQQGICFRFLCDRIIHYEREIPFLVCAANNRNFMYILLVKCQIDAMLPNRFHVFRPLDFAAFTVQQTGVPPVLKLSKIKF